MSGFIIHRVFNKDPIVWLNRGRPSPKYACKDVKIRKIAYFPSICNI